VAEGLDLSQLKGRQLMRQISLLTTALGVVLASGFAIAPASAQATRTWVSGVGDDANPCSRTAPCKTFAGAISKTATDGEMNCLDPGGFGGLTITKGMTINCEQTLGSVLVSGVNGIVISPAAGATIKVTLKGIEIEGLGTGLNAVSITHDGVILHMHKVQIRKFTQNGINFSPTLGSELSVSETYITDTGNGFGNAGISIQPGASAGTNAVIENVKLENNSNGLIANGSTSGTLNVTVKNTSATGSTNIGFSTNSPSNNINMMLNEVVSAGNGTGLQAGGGTVRIGSSVITGNTTGVSNPSGTLNSYKNNQINGNSGGEPVLTQVNFD